MKRRVTISIIIFIIFGFIFGLAEYFGLVSFNPTSVGFWASLIFSAALSCGIAFYKVYFAEEEDLKFEKVLGNSLKGISAAIIAFVVVVAASSPMFRAGSYASTFGEIQEAEFSGEIKETKDFANIAMMDSETARHIAARELGSMGDVMAQYKLGEISTLVVNGKTSKVAPLDYAGVTKYFHNKAKGTPGYVVVDTATQKAELVTVDGGINYSPAAYFGHDLMRHVHMAYPSLLLGKEWFELDESGNPYWAVQVMRAHTTLLNREIVGIVLVNATTGEMEKYDISTIPEWVDTVFDGDYISKKYNYFGKYQKGFWNSLFAKDGVTETTTIRDYDVNEDEHVKYSDYGFVTDENDVWVYTGITSASSSDRSNMGTLMVNQRTGEKKYFTLAGADEQSAMEAANGEVQQYGYTASFPTLVNVDGEPVYIMIMTDDSYIVKMYAMVSLEDYSHVAVGKTTDEVLRNYRKGVAVSTDSVAEDSSVRVESFTVENGVITLIFTDGTTTSYQMN